MVVCRQRSVGRAGGGWSFDVVQKFQIGDGMEAKGVAVSGRRGKLSGDRMS